RVLSATAVLLEGEVGRDVSVGGECLAGVAPFETHASEVIAGVVPDGDERSRAEGGEASRAAVRPDLPGEVARAALTVPAVHRAAGRHGGDRRAVERRGWRTG